MKEFPDISGITGSADRENIKIQNNYMFDALIRAIDFFSQKFNLDTLIDYASDFINEILTLEASAQFVYDKDSNSFRLRKSRIYKCGIKTIPNSKKLQRIAMLHGTILTSDFDSYFPEEFLKEYNPALLIPLIHTNGLIGFIVTRGKALGEFYEDDFSMATAIMRLFNSAFERNYFIEEHERSSKKLDNTMFELHTVNKTSKLLFEDINLEHLLSTGVEIFSEVSGSRVTAFAVKDDVKDSLVVKSYKDSRKNTKCPEDFHLFFCETPEFKKDKYIFEVECELEALGRIFKNPERFSELNAEYVVLIVKEKILGFVTLGKIKSAPRYNEEKLEIVNSLAISCFIALNNALLFAEIVRQKEELQSQYDKLLNYKV